MKIKSEFTADNLTIFGGFSNIFKFFTKSKAIDKLDRYISIKKIKKIYVSLDYVKILLTMLTFGFKNMNQISFLESDRYILKLLDLERFPHVSTLGRFLKRFTFKHCQEIVDSRRDLFKRFHKLAFNLKRITIDLDSTVLNICGHQEGAERGYNDKKRGNRSYNPLLAFIYETKEMLHGILRSGSCHCANGAVEFIKEVITMLPSRLYGVTFRADSGFFSDSILSYLESKGFNYIMSAKLYTNIVNIILSIRESTYSFYENGKEVAVFHYKMKSWDKKRKFIVVRTLRGLYNNQIELFESGKYEYQVFITNLNGDPQKLVRYYHKRGNSENYIKELKYDMHIGELNTDSFWANQALFQFSILCYNLLVWFKNIFIGKSELRTTIRTFRERFLLIPGKLIKRSRQVILKLPRDYVYKDIFKSIEIQLA